VNIKLIRLVMGWSGAIHWFHFMTELQKMYVTIKHGEFMHVTMQRFNRTTGFRPGFKSVPEFICRFRSKGMSDINY